MPVYGALLRGINLAGKRMVAMSDLRDWLTDLGCENPRSLLQSGNLVFRCDARPRASLEQWLEREAGARLHLHTDVFVRTAAELSAIVARNPFPDEATRDPAHLVVMFLKAVPATPGVDSLRAAIRGREVVHADGRHLYAVYPDGIGRSRLTNAIMDAKLGTRGTGRNWNTILKLAALATS